MLTGRRQDFSVDWQQRNRLQSYRFKGPQERPTKPNEASPRKTSEEKKENKTARKTTGDKQDLHLYQCGLRSVEKHVETGGGGRGVLTAKPDRKLAKQRFLKNASNRQNEGVSEGLGSRMFLVSSQYRGHLEHITRWIWRRYLELISCLFVSLLTKR